MQALRAAPIAGFFAWAIVGMWEPAGDLPREGTNGPEQPSTGIVEASTSLFGPQLTAIGLAIGAVVLLAILFERNEDGNRQD